MRRFNKVFTVAMMVAVVAAFSFYSVHLFAADDDWDLYADGSAYGKNIELVKVTSTAHAAGLNNVILSSFPPGIDKNLCSAVDYLMELGNRINPSIQREQALLATALLARSLNRRVNVHLRTQGDNYCTVIGFEF
jgi:hypothetical protein